MYNHATPLASLPSSFFFLSPFLPSSLACDGPNEDGEGTDGVSSCDLQLTAVRMAPLYRVQWALGVTLQCVVMYVGMWWTRGREEMYWYTVCNVPCHILSSAHCNVPMIDLYSTHACTHMYTGTVAYTQHTYAVTTLAPAHCSYSQHFLPPLDPVVVPRSNSPSPTSGILEGCIPVTGPVSVDGFELSTFGLGHPKELGCLECVFLLGTS